MAIEYVGGTSKGFFATAGSLSLTALTGGIDTQPQEGDYIIALTTNGSSTLGTPYYVTISGNNSGAYTHLIGSEQFANDTNEIGSRVYAKIQGSSPDTSLDHSGSRFSNDGATLIVHVWRGVDPNSPLDTASVAALGTNGSLPNPPAITPNTPGAIVVVTGGGVAADCSADFTTSGLSNVVQTFSGAGPEETRGLIGSVTWSSGAVNIDTFGGMATGTSDAWTAFVLALRPSQDPVTLEPEYVGGTSKGWINLAGTHSLTSLTGGSDTQPRNGDLVIVAVASGTSTRTVGDWATIAGDNTGSYVPLPGSQLFSNDTYESHLVVFAKIMGATPDTILNHGPSPFTTDGSALVVQVWRNIDPDIPVDTYVSATNINSSLPDPPAINPVSDKSVVIITGGGVELDCSAAYTTSGMQNVVQTFSGATNVEARALIGSVDWTSGTVNVGAFGGMSSTTSAAWTSYVFALRPKTYLPRAKRRSTLIFNNV